MNKLKKKKAIFRSCRSHTLVLRYHEAQSTNPLVVISRLRSLMVLSQICLPSANDRRLLVFLCNLNVIALLSSRSFVDLSIYRHFWGLERLWDPLYLVNLILAFMSPTVCLLATRLPLPSTILIKQTSLSDGWTAHGQCFLSACPQWKTITN